MSVEAGHRRAAGTVSTGVTFEEFAMARLPNLLRYAVVLTGDRELAQDVVQEVLARAHVRWRRISESESPEAYVRRMVLNEYLPGSIDADEIVHRGALVELLLSRCLDRRPFPDPPADPVVAVEDLLAVAAAALARG